MRFSQTSLDSLSLTTNTRDYFCKIIKSENVRFYLLSSLFIYLFLTFSNFSTGRFHWSDQSEGVEGITQLLYKCNACCGGAIRHNVMAV